ARAVGAQEGEDLSPLDLDAEAIDGGEVAESLGEVARLDDHAGRCASPRRVDSMSGAICAAKRTGPPGSAERSWSSRSAPARRSCRTSTRAKCPAARAPWT